jgi:hypothetical protein
MLCAILSLYTSSLTLWALGVTVWFQNAHLAFMGDPEIPLTDRKALVNDNIHRFNTQKIALYLFNVRVTNLVPCFHVSNILVILDGGCRLCCHLAGMGPLSKSTLGDLRALYYTAHSVQ